VRGDLEIMGSPTSPERICLESSQIDGTTTIRSHLGSQAPLIIAENYSPDFGGNVQFNNVNLSRCKLVGNSIRDMDLTDVIWAQRYGRNILYDENALRSGAPIPSGSLKEAYQLLKEKYRALGDHAKAGDFHYGEMEMKRREYGWPKRVLCPEFLYWLFSGYGVGYIRAFIVLLALVGLFAKFYLWTDSSLFSSSFLQSLLFSIQVSTLQRPSLPEELSQAGQWLRTVEMIFGPLQIALFALALRMRLKR